MVNYNQKKISKIKTSPDQIKLIILGLISLILVFTLNSCSQIVINEYNVFAVTTHTWRVEYFISRNEKQPRIEEFTSISLTNVNGEKPEEAFGEIDDKGLWWPKIPPKPSLDEIEELEEIGEQHSRPEILRTVKYSIIYGQGDNKTTLPTNYSVYRQGVKAISQGQSLKLTLGINDQSVEKAEPTP